MCDTDTYVVITRVLFPLILWLECMHNHTSFYEPFMYFDYQAPVFIQDQLVSDLAVMLTFCPLPVFGSESGNWGLPSNVNYKVGTMYSMFVSRIGLAVRR